MELTEKIKTLLAKESELSQDPQFRDLQEFFEKMKSEGIAVPTQYTLPSVDTIGRRLLEVTSRTDSQKDS